MDVPGTAMILFGVRSPIVVEHEETCHRLGLPVTAAVSVSGVPRVLDASRVIEWDAFRTAPLDDTFIACAFSPIRRRELTTLAQSIGLARSPALVDPTAILARSVRIGPGSFVNAGAIIGAVSLIGANVLVNRGATIGHHSFIADDVSIGPGVVIAGNVQIGAGTIIGAGARIMPDIRIGRDAVVAGGALVRRHVADGIFVDGHPAVERPFKLARSSLHVTGGE